MTPTASHIDDITRKVMVVTTASIPWMTGTAVNPLLRAAHLTEDRAAGMVTLVVPWVDEEDQRRLFPPGVTFQTQQDQREHILKWLAEEAHMPQAAAKLRVLFYVGRYHPHYGSIFAMGRVVECLPDEDADICILEEARAWKHVTDGHAVEPTSWGVGSTGKR